MTELKFRQIKKDGTFHYWGFVNGAFIAPDAFDDNLEACRNNSMQYAVLPNRDELEFCAGDIVEFTVFDHNDSDIQYVGVVVNTGTRFMIWCSVESEFYGSDGGFDLDWIATQDEEMKVLGNVHQNPALLK